MHKAIVVMSPWHCSDEARESRTDDSECESMRNYSNESETNPNSSWMGMPVIRRMNARERAAAGANEIKAIAWESQKKQAAWDESVHYWEREK
jgi:hypothetical protein